MRRAAEYEDDPQLQARDFLRTFEQPGLAPMAIEDARFARADRGASQHAGTRAGTPRDLHGLLGMDRNDVIARRQRRAEPIESRMPGSALRVSCSIAINAIACSGQVPATSSAASSRSAERRSSRHGS
jgi:hypothetical protein